jgi:hypothetical protein
VSQCPAGDGEQLRIRGPERDTGRATSAPFNGASACYAAVAGNGSAGWTNRGFSLRSSVRGLGVLPLRWNEVSTGWQNRKASAASDRRSPAVPLATKLSVVATGGESRMPSLPSGGNAKRIPGRAVHRSRKPSMNYLIFGLHKPPKSPRTCFD